MPAETEAMKLRRLGETADGLRDLELSLVQDVDNGDELDVIVRSRFDDDQKNPRKRYKLVKHIAKASKLDPLVHFDRVAFVDKSAEIACVAPPTDCVFWTDSAMEKFLFPYYEQVRIFPEDYLKQLKEAIRDPEKRRHIVAVRHDSPSSSDLVPDNGCGKSPPPGEVNVMLLVRREPGAPRAEWLTLGDFESFWRKIR